MPADTISFFFYENKETKILTRLLWETRAQSLAMRNLKLKPLVTLVEAPFWLTCLSRRQHGHTCANSIGKTVTKTFFSYCILSTLELGDCEVECEYFQKSSPSGGGGQPIAGALGPYTQVQAHRHSRFWNRNLASKEIIFRYSKYRSFSFDTIKVSTFGTQP